jgi:hypothetical protein
MTRRSARTIGSSSTVRILGGLRVVVMELLLSLRKGTEGSEKQKEALGTHPRASVGRALAIDTGEPDEV